MYPMAGVKIVRFVADGKMERAGYISVKNVKINNN